MNDKVKTPKPVNRARPSAAFNPEEYGLRSDVVRQSDASAIETRFNVPPELIPDGWTVQWKQASIYGEPCKPEEVIADASAGWQYAPAKWFAAMCPPGWNKAYVERGGQILMMRPTKLHEEALAEEHRKANQLLNQNKLNAGLLKDSNISAEYEPSAQITTNVGRLNPMEVPQ